MSNHGSGQVDRSRGFPGTCRFCISKTMVTILGAIVCVLGVFLAFIVFGQSFLSFASNPLRLVVVNDLEYSIDVLAVRKNGGVWETAYPSNGDMSTITSVDPRSNRTIIYESEGVEGVTLGISGNGVYQVAPIAQKGSNTIIVSSLVETVPVRGIDTRFFLQYLVFPATLLIMGTFLLLVALRSMDPFWRLVYVVMYSIGTFASIVLLYDFIRVLTF